MPKVLAPKKHRRFALIKHLLQRFIVLLSSNTIKNKEREWKKDNKMEMKSHMDVNSY